MMAIGRMQALVLSVVFGFGVATRLRRAAVRVPIVDVTEIVQRNSFTSSGYKCCCSKHKGWRDYLKFWTDHIGHCQVAKTEKCGGDLGLFGSVEVEGQNYIAHNYEDTDGKCELPVSALSFEDFYATHGSMSSYCDADIYFHTPSDEVLVASASPASLGEEVSYSCPDGWEAPLGENKVKCVFESAHAGRFTGVNCQKVHTTTKPTEDQNEDKNQDNGKGEDENLHRGQDGDDDEHDKDEDGGEDRHEGPTPSIAPEPTPTPIDAETIKTAIEGITEEATTICKRGREPEFCCVRQCKKLSEEIAKSIAVHVKATCVRECSKVWQGTH